MKKNIDFAWEGRTSKSPRSNEMPTYFENLRTYDAVCKVFGGLVAVVGLGGVRVFGSFLVQKSVSKMFYM